LYSYLHVLNFLSDHQPGREQDVLLPADQHEAEDGIRDWTCQRNGCIPRFKLMSSVISQRQLHGLGTSGRWPKKHNLMSSGWFVNRVTRFGEFPPIGWLFTVVGFFNYRISPLVWLRILVRDALFLSKNAWAMYVYFGRPFHKRIWSPCLSNSMG
jgi:hypothetical protein